MKTTPTRSTLIIIILLLFATILQAQDNRLEDIDKQLMAMIESGMDLDKPVTITLTGTIQELISFLAESTNLNISIASSVNRQISVTFSNATVKDIILYLCDNHNLTIRPAGDILYLLEYVPPPPPINRTEPDIDFNAVSGLIRMNLRNDPLEEVARKISALTDQNIALTPDIRGKKVSGFINNMPLEQALDQLAVSNNLLNTYDNGYYLLSAADQGNVFGDDPPANNGNTANRSGPNIQLRKTSNGQLNVRAIDVSIFDLIKATATELETSFYILAGISTSNNSGSSRPSSGSSAGDLSSTVSLQVQDASFEEIMRIALQNTPFTAQKRTAAYVIGRREAESLRTSQVFQMQYRSIRGMDKLIPDFLREGVNIDTLYEQNSLILSGSRNNINETVDFLRSLDKVVPMVTIELTIVDVAENQLDDYGVEAGISPGGREPGGAIISSNADQGGIDFNFSPGAINRLLNQLAGQGIINLGQVSPDFYLNLRALQEDGVVDIKSTPKLSTLNSHEAILSIGQTRYYQEQQVTFPGTQQPIPIQANIFREVEANLFISLNPIVSGDEEVTLEIFFEQSEFLDDSGPNAPPPQASRQFQSIVRVRNNETIVLGGLERDLKSVNKSGLPFISRIPIIGWIFGRHRKTKQKSKLLIFAKPTIIN